MTDNLLLVVYNEIKKDWGARSDSAIQAVLQTAEGWCVIAPGVWFLKTKRDVDWWANNLLPHIKAAPCDRDSLLVMNVDTQEKNGNLTGGKWDWFRSARVKSDGVAEVGELGELVTTEETDGPES